MNIRRVMLVSLLFIVPRLLWAQEALAQEAPVPEGAPFPLSLVLEAVYGGAGGRWRPDWPLDIPPDAFTVKGAASRISLDLDGVSYDLARDAQGRLTDFPLVVPAIVGSDEGPVLAQAGVRYHAEGGIAGLSVRLPSALTWTAQFPLSYIPGHGTPPAKGEDAVKVQCESQLYYVLFSEGAAEIAETWFDPWGEFVAYFTTRVEGTGSPWGIPWRVLSQDGASFRRDYRYESGGNLSQYAGNGGQFSAFYSAQQRPLYLAQVLSSETRIFSFQWDEQGLLTRMRDISPEAPPVPVDFRYEYEFDARGNWVLRRETALFLRDGLLLPASAREVTRKISYTQGE
jgi:hypothetical protein